MHPRPFGGVAAASLGDRHECSECGTKYYDLGRLSVACPRCGNLAEVNNLDLTKGDSKRSQSTSHEKSRPEKIPDEDSATDSIKDDNGLGVLKIQRRSIHQAETLLDLAERVLPRKHTHEVIGDCYERIETDDAHHMLVQLDALCTVWWAVVFTLKEFVKPGALIAALWKFLGS